MSVFTLRLFRKRKDFRRMVSPFGKLNWLDDRDTVRELVSPKPAVTDPRRCHQVSAINCQIHSCDGRRGR